MNRKKWTGLVRLVETLYQMAEHEDDVRWFDSHGNYAVVSQRLFNLVAAGREVKTELVSDCLWKSLQLDDGMQVQVSVEVKDRIGGSEIIPGERIDIEGIAEALGRGSWQPAEACCDDTELYDDADEAVKEQTC